MRFRVAQAMLVVVMLVQPVSVFAAVRAPLGAGGQAMTVHANDAAGAMSVAGADIQSPSDQQPCHTTETNVPAGNCCNTMESANCLLSCYAVACALSVSGARETVIQHVAVQPGAINSYLYQSLSGIFHPPRIS